MTEVTICLCLGALLGYYLGFLHGRLHPVMKGAGA